MKVKHYDHIVLVTDKDTVKIQIHPYETDEDVSDRIQGSFEDGMREYLQLLDDGYRDVC